MLLRMHNLALIMKHIHLIFGLCIISVFAEDVKLPDFIHVCHRNDPNITECWQNSVLHLKPYLLKGIPELDLPSLDPLMLKELHMKQGDTPSMSFQATLTDVKVKGGANFDIEYAYVDILKERVHTFVDRFPKYELTGHYKAKGRVLLFQLEGEGKIELEITDILLNATWYFKLVKKNGKEHLLLDKQQLDVEPKQMHLYLHDLFKNNPELTNHVNNAINENMDALAKDFKPVIIEILSSVYFKYFNRVFEKFPYDVLLPP